MHWIVLHPSSSIPRFLLCAYAYQDQLEALPKWVQSLRWEQVEFMDSVCSPKLNGEGSDHLDRRMRIASVQIVRSMVRKVNMKMMSINIENSLPLPSNRDNYMCWFFS